MSLVKLIKKKLCRHKEFKSLFYDVASRFDTQIKEMEKSINLINIEKDVLVREIKILHAMIDEKDVNEVLVQKEEDPGALMMEAPSYQSKYEMINNGIVGTEMYIIWKKR